LDILAEVCQVHLKGAHLHQAILAINLIHLPNLVELRLVDFHQDFELFMLEAVHQLEELHQQELLDLRLEVFIPVLLI